MNEYRNRVLLSTVMNSRTSLFFTILSWNCPRRVKYGTMGASTTMLVVATEVEVDVARGVVLVAERDFVVAGELVEVDVAREVVLAVEVDVEVGNREFRFWSEFAYREAVVADMSGVLAIPAGTTEYRYCFRSSGITFSHESIPEKAFWKKLFSTTTKIFLPLFSSVYTPSIHDGVSDLVRALGAGMSIRTIICAAVSRILEPLASVV